MTAMSYRFTPNRSSQWREVLSGEGLGTDEMVDFGGSSPPSPCASGLRSTACS